MTPEQFLNSRNAHPIVFSDTYSCDLKDVIEKAPQAILKTLEQKELTDERRSKLFAGMCEALGSFALQNPNMMVEVEWFDEHKLPVPSFIEPLEAMRRIAVNNIIEQNNILLDSQTRSPKSSLSTV